ncbi:MAG: (2Fe-2S)-binding protein [Robiginitomaculum sp.]|nr:MAG: (2Fe-2S)-binding protein [Robiginitomaculum sp.]
MSHGYQAIQWNGFKWRYDIVMLLGVAAFITAFSLMTMASRPPEQSLTMVQVLIRAFGASAFLLLTVILAIGPLARLSARFKPLLYNRRHMGVLCFILALVHAGLSLLWYQGFSALNPVVALFVSNARYTSIAGFPFESLGVVALILLAFLAVSSHDYWQAALGPTLWKRIHMGVYVAYGLLVMHVLLGTIQGEKDVLYPVSIIGAFCLLAFLHGASALAGRFRDKTAAASLDGWINIGAPDNIPENRARIIKAASGDRIAVFRYDGKISAVTNVCAHQNGPLGEGRIVDGCITCPWHGWQYRPEDGRSPAPFDEKISTYRVQVDGGMVYVHPEALPPGTPTPPALIKEVKHDKA